MVKWIIAFLSRVDSLRDWSAEKEQILQTVDTFCMLTYDPQAAEIHAETRAMLVESQLEMVSN